MHRGEASAIEDNNYSRDFKAQLSQKVLTKIEKRFNSIGELSEAETRCLREAQHAVQLA